MKKIILLLFLLLITNTLFAQERVPMSSENGKSSIPCEVNGLKLNCRFDTNRSSSVISQIDASFMLKNGYISKNDVYLNGKLPSNGNIPENTTINLKNIKIGSKEITNIPVTVSSGAKTALTLGQSAIQKIGKYYIKDNYLVLEESNLPNYTIMTPSYNWSYKSSSSNQSINSSKDTTIYYPDNKATYVGQYSNGSRNGKGVMTWESGAKYVGNFSNESTLKSRH